MFVRKLYQFYPRVVGRLQLRVTTHGQNATLCDQKHGFTTEVPEEQPAAVSSSVEEPIGKESRLKTLLEQKAEMFLADLDEDGLKRKEDIKVTMEMLRVEGRRVPTKLTAQDWKILLTEHHTQNSRAKYLSKRCLDEWRKQKDVEKKLLKRQMQQEQSGEKKVQTVSVHIPARDQEAKAWKKIQALASDLNVVYDLDFEQTSREKTNCFDQVQRLWSNNINHLQPLNIHITSVNQNERFQDFIHYNRRVPVNFYEEYFLDIFREEDLVYLTPDGPPMLEFDPTCTYVVGGLVDLQGKSRLTYGRAKAHGIRAASFPLNKYCDFSFSGRAKHVQTLDCVHNILLDMFLHHSWKVALQRNLRNHYIFRHDRKSEDFAVSRQKMMEKRLFKKFDRTRKAMR